MQRKQLSDDYFKRHVRICDLKERCHVSLLQQYTKNARRTIILASTEASQAVPMSRIRVGTFLEDWKPIEEKLRKRARRYINSIREKCPILTQNNSLISSESPKETREYLFVGINDFSRELFAAILPDKAQYSSEAFLLEYRGNSKSRAFMKFCCENGIEQRETHTNQRKS